MDLCLTPDNPPPPGAVAVPVTTGDGLRLRAMLAQPSEARGTVVLIGGRGDYLERYFETAREVIGRGYAVVAFDFRGQGGSQRLLANPMRNHVRRFADYEEDLRAVMSQLVLPRCPAPYYAVAHSTGGAVLMSALTSQSWFRRAVVTAPLVGLLYGNWPRSVVRLLVFLANAVGLGWMFLPGQAKLPLGRKDFPGNLLHGDERRWNRDSAVLEACPQLGVGGPTFAWLRAARKATARLRAMGHRTRLNCPVLLVVAGRDRVVDNAASYRLARRVSGISLIEISEARHEILSGPDAIRAQFFAAFDAFLGETEPAQSA
jgi:lysophospholipase